MSAASAGLLQVKCSEPSLTFCPVTASSAILPVVTALSASFRSHGVVGDLAPHGVRGLVRSPRRSYFAVLTAFFFSCLVPTLFFERCVAQGPASDNQEETQVATTVVWVGRRSFQRCFCFPRGRGFGVCSPTSRSEPSLDGSRCHPLGQGR